MSVLLNRFSANFCHQGNMFRKNDYARSCDLTTEATHRTRVRRNSLDLKNVSKAAQWWISDIVANLLITVSCILWSNMIGRSDSDSNDVLTSLREDLPLRNILRQIRWSKRSDWSRLTFLTRNVRRTLDATARWWLVKCYYDRVSVD